MILSVPGFWILASLSLASISHGYWQNGHMTINAVAQAKLLLDGDNVILDEANKYIDLLIERYPDAISANTTFIRSAIWMDEIKGQTKMFNGLHYNDVYQMTDGTQKCNEKDSALGALDYLNKELDALIAGSCYVFDPSQSKKPLFTAAEGESCTDQTNLCTTFVSGRKCQCDPQCGKYNNCCRDNIDVCSSYDMNDPTFALRFITHVVGDLHQPLHAGSACTEKFSNGDRGGNYWTLYYKGERINLHMLFDAMGYQYKTDVLGGTGKEFTGEEYQDEAIKNADNLIRTYPVSSFPEFVAGEIDFVKWSEESSELARCLAYSADYNSSLTEEYIQDVREASNKRVVLAGYRIAEVLKHAFK